MVRHTRFPWAEEGKLIVAEGSKQKQMGKYDVCEQPQWMEEDDGGIEGHTRSAGSTCFQLNGPPSFEAFLHPVELELRLTGSYLSLNMITNSS